MTTPLRFVEGGEEDSVCSVFVALATTLPLFGMLTTMWGLHGKECAAIRVGIFVRGISSH